VLEFQPTRDTVARFAKSVTMANEIAERERQTIARVVGPNVIRLSIYLPSEVTIDNYASNFIIVKNNLLMVQFSNVHITFYIRNAWLYYNRLLGTPRK